MKVLLVHPQDSPVEGPWASACWDLVVDFGWAGSHCYAQWSKALGCPVRGLYSFREWEKDVGEIKEAFTTSGPSAHLCRCGSYTAILEAVQRAAKVMAEGGVR